MSQEPYWDRSCVQVSFFFLLIISSSENHQKWDKVNGHSVSRATWPVTGSQTTLYPPRNKFTEKLDLTKC